MRTIARWFIDGVKQLHVLSFCMRGLPRPGGIARKPTINGAAIVAPSHVCWRATIPWALQRAESLTSLSLSPFHERAINETSMRLVAFLASERARNITGQALNVDGGIYMH
jgi:NAD(P)-dependent dehydrogenase (short-subunit alcohol dehydrogenase family)